MGPKRIDGSLLALLRQHSITGASTARWRPCPGCSGLSTPPTSTKAHATALFRTFTTRRRSLPVNRAGTLVHKTRRHHIRGYGTAAEDAHQTGGFDDLPATVPPPPPKNVAVLGGGVTGLTAAYYLALKLPSTSHVTLYEAGDRLGGWIHTRTVDVDVGGVKGQVRFEPGPRTLRSLRGDPTKAEDLVMYDLMHRLGIRMETVNPAMSRRRYLYDSRRLVQLSSSPEGIDKLRDSPLSDGLGRAAVSMALKLLWTRLAGARPPADEVAIGEFVRWLTGGTDVVDNLLSAIVHGIYGGDVDRLSLSVLYGQQLHSFYHRRRRPNSAFVPAADLVLMSDLGRDKGVVAASAGIPVVGMFSPEGGMAALVRALEEKLREFPNVSIKLGSPVKSVKNLPEKGVIEVTTEKDSASVEYDKVISTINANKLSDLADGQLPSLANSPAVSIMAVNLWYPQPRLVRERGVGYLIPRSVEDNVEGALGVFFDGDVLPTPTAPHEPAGTKLFVLMGGHHWDKLVAAADRGEEELPSPDDGILMAKNVVYRHLGIPVDAPCHAEATLARDCIPQHVVGHWARMRTAHAELEANYDGRLAVAGGSYFGIGVVPSMRAGYDVASAAAGEPRPDLGVTGLARFAGPVTTGSRMLEVDRAELRHLCGDVKVIRDVGWKTVAKRIFGR